MNLFFFNKIRAEDFNATEAPVLEDDDLGNVLSSAASNSANVNRDKEDRVTQLSEVPDMSSIPKLPRPTPHRNATSMDMEFDEMASTMDASTQVNAESNEEGSLLKESHKIHDIPLIPEAPNVAERDKLETTAEHVTSTFSREFKTFIDEAASIEEQLPVVRPYIIGGAIVVPAFLMIRNIRRQGLVNYIHKSPLQGKLIQLLVFSSGIAAGTYFYKKPRKTKYVKDFRDA